MNVTISEPLAKFLLIIIMLIAPPSIFTLVMPTLSRVDFTNYPYLPSIIPLILLLIWVADWAGMVYLIRRWFVPSG